MFFLVVCGCEFDNDDDDDDDEVTFCFTDDDVYELCMDSSMNIFCS